jgi:hypothetical protein
MEIPNRGHRGQFPGTADTTRQRSQLPARHSVLPIRFLEQQNPDRNIFSDSNSEKIVILLIMKELFGIEKPDGPSALSRP